MDAEQNSTEISVVDYLFKNHPHLFARMIDNPYWRGKKAKQIVARMLGETIIYRDRVLTTDAQTQKDIDAAVNEWYPSRASQKAKSARVSLHSIFTEVVQKELGYDEEQRFNLANDLRKKYVSDKVIQQCCIAIGSGKSRRYKVNDSKGLENRVRQLLREDDGLKMRRQEIRAEREAETGKKLSETRKASKVTFSLCGKNIEIYPTNFYSRKSVLQILQLVHRDVFSEPRIDKIFNKLGENGELKGSNLVEIINKTNGIMNLSSRSVQLRLENRVSLDYKEIARYLESLECKKYVHLLEGIIDGPYVLKHELDGLCEDIRVLRTPVQTPIQAVIRPLETPATDTHLKLVEDGGDKLTSVLNEVRDSLRRDRKCPEGKVYLKLLKAEVLDESSVESIRETYGAFAKEMDGYGFFDFNIVRNGMGRIGWAEFKEGPMNLLIQSGIAKDVVASLGYAENKANFYVLKRGGKDEMCKILNLDRALFNRT